MSDRLTSQILAKEPTDIYSEDAFQHFLNVERERSARSDRRSLLLQVGLKSPGGSLLTLRAVADALFASLAQSIRETDFMGWYREPRLIGAVLTELSEERDTEGLDQVVSRIQRACEDSIPQDSANRLDISVTTITGAELRS